MYVKRLGVLAAVAGSCLVLTACSKGPNHSEAWYGKHSNQAMTVSKACGEIKYWEMNTADCVNAKGALGKRALSAIEPDETPQRANNSDHY